LRFFQGMGAAALGTLNVTVIGDIYGGRERSAAIGGALATFGWFYPFALPVIAVPIGVFVVFSPRNPEPCNEQGLKEYFGSVWWHLADREVVGLFGIYLLTFVILFGPHSPIYRYS
jgi:ACDE family multidrug resistance protein